MLEAGEGPVRLEGDRLVVGRDTGDDLPASVERLKGLVLGVLPEVELTEVVSRSTRRAASPSAASGPRAG